MMFQKLNVYLVIVILLSSIIKGNTGETYKQKIIIEK